MTSAASLLLLTRPRAASEAFLATLSLRDVAAVDVCVSPLMEIVPRVSEIEFGVAQGVIFTSANAVRIATELTVRRDLAAYCVGDATTQLASGSGWMARMMGTDANALVLSLIQLGLDGPLLHLRGLHARGDIAAKLTDAGCTTSEQIVYEAIALPFSKDTCDQMAQSKSVIAPVFSPRSGALLADSYRIAAPLTVAAISPAAAQPLKNVANRVEIAHEPTAAAMRKLVEKLVNKASRVEGQRGAH